MEEIEVSEHSRIAMSAFALLNDGSVVDYTDKVNWLETDNDVVSWNREAEGKKVELLVGDASSFKQLVSGPVTVRVDVSEPYVVAQLDITVTELAVCGNGLGQGLGINVETMVPVSYLCLGVIGLHDDDGRNTNEVDWFVSAPPSSDVARQMMIKGISGQYNPGQLFTQEQGQQWCLSLNEKHFLGLSDWQLPSEEELKELLYHAEGSNKSIVEEYRWPLGQYWYKNDSGEGLLPLLSSDVQDSLGYASCISYSTEDVVNRGVFTDFIDVASYDGENPLLPPLPPLPPLAAITGASGDKTLAGALTAQQFSDAGVTGTNAPAGLQAAKDAVIAG
ncbi:DUF1566 domain-containing protein, partial [Vibrio mediterranei]|nr:DUF1566 domain-containing protein [Vibrio mediterranei]